MAEKTEEKLPISEFNKVVDYVTVFKSQKWWEAIVLFEAYGKRAIGLYLWEKRKDLNTGVEVWKRKHKFNIRSLDEWNKLKDVVEQLLPKLVSR